MRFIVVMCIVLTASRVMADGRHVMVAVPQSVWASATPTKREAIVAFFHRFTDPSASSPIQAVTYTHRPSSELVMVACFWTERDVRRYSERITAAKIDSLKEQLADNRIRLVFTDNPAEQLEEWELYQPPIEEME